MPHAERLHALRLVDVDIAVERTPVPSKRAVRRHRRAPGQQQDRHPSRYHGLAVFAHHVRIILLQRPPVIGKRGDAEIPQIETCMREHLLPGILQERTLCSRRHRDVIHRDTQGHLMVAQGRLDVHHAEVKAGGGARRHIDRNPNGLRCLGRHAHGAGIRQGVRFGGRRIQVLVVRIEIITLTITCGAPRNKILRKTIAQVAGGNRIRTLGEVGKRDPIDGEIGISAQHNLPMLIVVPRRRQDNVGRPMPIDLRLIAGHQAERVGRPHIQRAVRAGRRQGVHHRQVKTETRRVAVGVGGNQGVLAAREGRTRRALDGATTGIETETSRQGTLFAVADQPAFPPGAPVLRPAQRHQLVAQDAVAAPGLRQIQRGNGRADLEDLVGQRLVVEVGLSIDIRYHQVEPESAGGARCIGRRQGVFGARQKLGRRTPDAPVGRVKNEAPGQGGTQGVGHGAGGRVGTDRRQQQRRYDFLAPNIHLVTYKRHNHLRGPDINRHKLPEPSEG